MRHSSNRSTIGPKRAFTLIELLVVIAIIAILAAILFPVFAQAKAAAKSAVTLSNAKQEMLGLQLYINDYDDLTFLPWGTGIYPVQLLYPYVKNIDLAWDASSPIPNFNDPMVGNIPGNDPRFWGDWTLTGTLSWSQNGLYSNGLVPRNYSAQEHPANTAVLVPFSNPDGEYFNGPATNYATGDLGWFTFDPTNFSCYGDYTGANWNNNARNGITRAANTWHSGGYITGFEDGHAKNVKGQTYDDTTAGNGCGLQTYNYWNINTSGGSLAPTDANMMTAQNPWSQWLLQPQHLQYWGTWWDTDQ
jgi:prepilin-type N-terminal cleavage/methylation domain-containing protein